MTRVDFSLLGRPVRLCSPAHLMDGQAGYISAQSGTDLEVTFTDDSTTVVTRADVVLVEYRSHPLTRADSIDFWLAIWLIFVCSFGLGVVYGQWLAS